MSTRIKLGLAILLAAIAAVLAWRTLGKTQADSHVDAPGGTHWTCTQPTCGTDFTLTIAELSDFYNKNPESEPPCPRCGKPGARATACPHCGKTIPKLARSDRQAQTATCPKCGKPIQSAASGSGR
ncbi:MAG: hypothetical protein IT435_14285 [Phycisphaerales bacterium]|nr:hypothetical protein [Phycisphaerales bacterium]